MYTWNINGLNSFHEHMSIILRESKITQERREEIEYINKFICKKTGFNDLIILYNSMACVNDNYFNLKFMELLIEVHGHEISIYDALWIVCKAINYLGLFDKDKYIEVSRCICNGIKEYLDHEQYIDEIMNDLKYM